MPREERGRRMRRMREVVAEHNVYRWAGKIVSALVQIDPEDSSRADACAPAAVPVLAGGPDGIPLAAARGA
jgi:trehalose 6-phosphate synthase